MDGYLSFPSIFMASNVVNNAGRTPLSLPSELLTRRSSYNVRKLRYLFGTFEIFSPDIYRVSVARDSWPRISTSLLRVM